MTRGLDGRFRRMRRRRMRNGLGNDCRGRCGCGVLRAHWSDYGGPMDMNWWMMVGVFVSGVLVGVIASVVWLARDDEEEPGAYIEEG